MSKLLEGLGYQVTVKRDVKVGAFQDVVVDYAETIKPDDEVFFHYARHGGEIEGQVLLLGVDFKARTRQRAQCEGFSVSETVELMGRGRVFRHVTVLGSTLAIDDTLFYFATPLYYLFLEAVIQSL